MEERFQPSELHATAQNLKETILSKQLQLPAPISAFIEATIAHDTNGLFAALTASAVITDEGHEYRGTAAIKDSSYDKFGASLKIFIVFLRA
jgi:hypothetical protein